MTAVPADVAPESVVPAFLRNRRLGPAEGWTSVVLVALMAATLGFSLDDPRYVLGVGEWTDFLPWVAALGALVGTFGAKTGWPRTVAHLAGAVVAALVLPIIVGSVLVDGPGSPVDFYAATYHSAAKAWLDLGILNRTFTREYGHYLLALGILAWGTGQYAGYAVFGHRRPLDAIVIVGLALLVNMSITFDDQLPILIAFTLCALFILARWHAFDEQTMWVRRRIGDPAAVRSLYLRGGTVFIGAAVFLALALTATASSAPLAGLWTDASGFVISLSQQVERFLPGGGTTRPIGVSFDEQTQIGAQWTTSDAIAVTIQLSPDEEEAFYWRAIAYDTFDVTGWSVSDPHEVARGAQEPLLAGLGDDPTPFGGREVRFVVSRAAGYPGPLVLSPQTPVGADLGGVLTVAGDAGFMGSLRLDGNPQAYEVTALVPTIGDTEPTGLTANRLRAAGTDYPVEVAARYLNVPGDAVGPNALALLAEIEQLAPDNPYDLARTMETVLRNPTRFTYDTDIRDVDCAGMSAVECLATYKQGFCQYYASTMAILLRVAGVPARMVEGFLPGERDATGLEQIPNSSAHAWVEVYFPGFGWVSFDPTGGGVAADTSLPPGAPVSPGPSVSLPPASGFIEPDDPTVRPGTLPSGPRTPQQDSPIPFILVTILLAVVVGGLAFVAWQRGPRSGIGPDDAWRGVSRLAGRFGFGPRPTQTVYEYAAALGAVVPAARPELEVVARAKVEVAYGRASLGETRLRQVRDASRRLRVRLLRLAMRRLPRRRR
jgi:transglutaminase-like putative cysteine protease